MRCGCPSRPRTPTACHRASPAQSVTPTSATRHLRLLVLIFFSAMSGALDRPADRSLARPNRTNSIEELTPLAVGSPGPSFDVFLEHQHGTLVQLRRLAQPPLWGKRAALVEPLKVTVDRRAVDPEPTGGLAFGNALLFERQDLSAPTIGGSCPARQSSRQPATLF